MLVLPPGFQMIIGWTKKEILYKLRIASYELQAMNCERYKEIITCNGSSFEQLFYYFFEATWQ